MSEQRVRATLTADSINAEGLVRVRVARFEQPPAVGDVVLLVDEVNEAAVPATVARILDVDRPLALMEVDWTDQCDLVTFVQAEDPPDPVAREVRAGVASLNAALAAVAERRWSRT